MSKAIVYLATNIKNGKRYIGVSSKRLRWRRAQHEYEALKGKACCRRFHNSIRKYGPENFQWEVISSHDLYADALAEEVRQIAERKPEYNITSGGEGSKGFRHTAEWKAEKSSSMRGRVLSEEHRRKISDGLKDAVWPNDMGKNISAGKKGKALTDAHRIALSISHKGKPMSDAQRKAFKPTWVKGMKMDPAIIAKRVASRLKNREAINVVSVATG